MQHDQPSHSVRSLMPNIQQEDPTALKTAWTEAEIEQVVQDYFTMRALFLQGEPFVKAHYYKETAKQLGRSVASIEHKYMNISATLERLSLPWVSGYAPLRNFQNALLKAVETRVAQKWDGPIIPEQTIRTDSDIHALAIEAPPSIHTALTSTHPELERIARRFDPALRDERNRKLGAQARSACSNQNVLASPPMGAPILQRKLSGWRRNRAMAPGTTSCRSSPMAKNVFWK